MNKETLGYANKLVSVIDSLNDLNSIMYDSFPQFSGYENRNVNSARFDEETLKRLKAVIKNFIDERKKELQEEFEKL